MSKVFQFSPIAVAEYTVVNQIPNTANGDFYFDRDTEASIKNKDGNIEFVKENIPRLDFSKGSCPAIFTETDSVNLVTYSEDFSNASWFKRGTTTITSNSGISPKGEQDATLLSNTTSANYLGSNNIRRDISVSANKDYTYSVYIKKLNSTKATISLRDNTSGVMNLADIDNSIDDWQRISVSITTGSTASTLGIAISNTDDDVLIFGVQLEQQEYATTYIKTNGSTEERLEEVLEEAYFTNDTPNEGTIYYEVEPILNSASSDKSIRVEGGGGGYITLELEDDTNAKIQFFPPNSQVPTEIINYGYDVSQRMKIHFRYSVGQVDSLQTLFINGLKVGETNIETITFTTLDSVKTADDNNNKIYTGWLYGMWIDTEQFTDNEIIEQSGFDSFIDMASYLNYEIV